MWISVAYENICSHCKNSVFYDVLSLFPAPAKEANEPPQGYHCRGAKTSKHVYTVGTSSVEAVSALMCSKITVPSRTW